MTRLRNNDPCWCGSGQKLKRCHGDHQRHRRPPVVIGRVGPPRPVPATVAPPPYVRTGRRPDRAGVQVHGPAELDRLRHAGQVAAEVLTEVGREVAAGVTTDQLDEAAHEAYLRRGAYPSTLGYKGYDKAICTSVNEVVCHGIPDDRPLATGDIVNIDVTAYVEGMHGDTSATFVVGGADAPTTALVALTREATLLGIAAVGPGRPVRVVGEAIQPFAFRHGLGVVRDWGGHGIGEVFHAAPHVHHSVERESSTLLVPGMTFTVEPMLTAGLASHHTVDDGWTVVTDDGLPSAQFEHTVVVTDDGVEILTLCADGTSPVGRLGTHAGSPAPPR